METITNLDTISWSRERSIDELQSFVTSRLAILDEIDL